MRRLAFCIVLAAAPANAEEITASAAPFVWAPSMQGTLQQGPIIIPLDTSARDLAGGIKAGGMIHGEADTRAVHASVQVIYADFHNTCFAPVFGADVKSSLFTVEAMAGPRIRLGKAEVSPMVGLRHTRIRGTFDAAGLGRLSAGRTWNEGLVGVEWQVPLSDTVSLHARGTVALTGPQGQSSHDLIAAGTWRFARNVSLALGYRWARERVLAGKPGDFALNLKAHGPVVGFVFGL